MSTGCITFNALSIQRVAFCHLACCFGGFCLASIVIVVIHVDELVLSGGEAPFRAPEFVRQAALLAPHMGHLNFSLKKAPSRPLKCVTSCGCETLLCKARASLGKACNHSRCTWTYGAPSAPVATRDHKISQKRSWKIAEDCMFFCRGSSADGVDSALQSYTVWLVHWWFENSVRMACLISAYTILQFSPLNQIELHRSSPTNQDIFSGSVVETRNIRAISLRPSRLWETLAPSLNISESWFFCQSPNASPLKRNDRNQRGSTCKSNGTIHTWSISERGQTSTKDNTENKPELLSHWHQEVIRKIWRSAICVWWNEDIKLKGYANLFKMYRLKFKVSLKSVGSSVTRKIKSVLSRSNRLLPAKR